LGFFYWNELAGFGIAANFAGASFGGHLVLLSAPLLLFYHSLAITTRAFAGAVAGGAYISQTAFAAATLGAFTRVMAHRAFFFRHI
jgi:hypothetical protein